MLTVCALSGGCVHKVLTDAGDEPSPDGPGPVGPGAGGKALVLFDWSEAGGNPSPDRVTLLCYPLSAPGTPGLAYLPMKGGELEITPGRYDMVSFTAEPPADLTPEGLLLTTESVDILSPLGLTSSSAGDEPVVAAPQRVWYGRNRGFTAGDDPDRTDTCPIPMRDAFIVLHVLYPHVLHSERIEAASVALSGMGAGFMPAAGEVSALRATIPFAATAAEGRVSAETPAFGHCPDGEPCRHELSLFLKLAGGELKRVRSDVSAQMQAQRGQKDVYITIDELISPEMGVDFSIGTDGGIAPMQPGDNQDVS